MAFLHLSVPSLCAACGRACRPEAVICTRCSRRLSTVDPLAGNGPAGLDRVWSSAPFEGVARDLVAALRFRHLLGVAELVAERIEWLAPLHLLTGTIVPVPAEPRRLGSRRFDPAGEIAEALAERLDAPLSPCLDRRLVSPKPGSRGLRPRARRSVVRARSAAPRSALLVDDVLASGEALTQCAHALRAAGASRVVAITFARCL